MDVQPFSVNDGDGIRTTIFLAGCPLRCAWCSNPEGFSAAELVGWREKKCIGCGECTRACPEDIGIDMNKERKKCIACGRCTLVCPVGARVYMVKLRAADEVISEIQKYRLFYVESGGGITFSGGEATSQPAFLDHLSREIYDLGYSMDIETSGMFEFEELEETLARMDLIFMDLKLMDEEAHKRCTGVSNTKIKDNIKKVAGLCDPDKGADQAKLVVRVPVVSGVNDSEENIRETAAFVHENAPGAAMELLPYHELGRIKYAAIGMPYAHEGFSRPTKEKIDALNDIIKEEGVQLADFR